MRRRSFTIALLLTLSLPLQAAKAYEDHVAKNGQPDSHAKAKEILAALAGGFVDRIVETKGVCVSSLSVEGIIAYATLPA